MARLMTMLLLSTLLVPAGLVWSVASASAAPLIYDANDAAIDKIAKGVGTGVKDVAAAAAAMPSAGTTAVVFAGHGESGVTGLGSGQSSGYTKGLDLKYGKLDDVADSLTTINKHLKAGSIVILSSCSTGSDPDGAKFLEQLSAHLTNATIFANKNCVGLTKDLKKGSVCTADGNTYWQTSSTIAANNGKSVKVGRDEIKAVTAASCAP